MQNAHSQFDFYSRILQSKSLCLEVDIVQITGKLIDKTFLIAKPINPNPFFDEKKELKGANVCIFRKKKKKI